MPPPPPPPPGPPPPPMMAPSSAPSGASGETRNMLLSSIRQGAKLKKTVTNDKSGPFIPGNVTSGSSGGGVESSREGSREASAPRMNGGPPQLGGLFAGGMPKLRPTGLNIGSPASPGSGRDVRDGPAKTMTTNSSDSRLINMNRGPPPQPPPASNKPNLSSSTTEPNNNNDGFSSRPILPNKPPVGGYGKPNLAPRPPPPAAPNMSSLHGANDRDKPSPPPKTLNVNGRQVSRAQSLRAPRSPPVAPPSANSNGPLVAHLSQEGLNFSKTGTLPHNFHHNQMKVAPSPPAGVHRVPPRAPVARPPPPPNRTAPPTTAPPPPPHRTSPAPPPPRLPAMPNSAPPAPPTRNSSMRNGSSTSSLVAEIEKRFSFHSIQEFPQPTPFRNLNKQYNRAVNDDEALWGYEADLITFD